MNLDFVLKLVNFIIKDFREITQPIADNVVFSDQLHYAQLKYFKRKIGLPELYTPGIPLPAQAFEITKRITEDLRPFKVIMGWKEGTPLVVDEKGNANYPSDYYYPSVMTAFTNDDKKYEREIEFLADAEFTKRTTSFSEKPTEFFPVVNLQSGAMRFFPISINLVNFVYIRLPVKPFMAVSSARGFVEYDADASTELEWNDICIIDIVVDLLNGLGISVKSEAILDYSEKLRELNYSEKLKQQGG